MSSSTSVPASSPWLFGRGVDLWLGYGLAYLASVPLVAWLVTSGSFGAGPVWGTAALALFFSTPHYGATILRVYDRRQDRRRYALFAVWITAALVALFGLGLWSTFIGSLLLTAYVTWSPWHFSGQNYGLAVMYLRRRGIAFTPETKRDLYLSFVLSAVLAILAIHVAGSSLVFANGAGDGSGTFGVLQLGLPATFTRALVALAALAYLGLLARVARALLRQAPAAALGPVVLLVGTQALWFSMPALATALAATDLPAGLALPLSAVWISTAHAIQYLWVTCYYTRRTGEAAGVRSFLARSLVAGAFLSVPGFLLFPAALGGHFPNAAGAAVLVFSVVNLHHFILDGAIWKLRDGKVARALLRPADGTEEAAEAGARRRWLRPLVVTLGATSVVLQLYTLWLAHVASSPDTPYVVLRSAATELHAMGQAPPSLWARLGQLAEAESEPEVAVVAYRRAVRGDRQPPAWVADRLAWLLLARHADDPTAVSQALQLADYVSRILGPEKPEGFLTLAAAHAAAREWDAAAAAAADGLAAARAGGDQPRAQELERRLALYRQQARAPGAASVAIP